MEFRLFGEVRVLAGDRPLDVGTPRQQAVLAALLVDAGRPVDIETLIDRVWDEAPPVEARNVLYSHLSRIRRLLATASGHTGVRARLERRSAGYVLDVDPDLVDLHRFARLTARGPAGDTARAAALTEALDLWSGPPLAGISGDWVDQVRNSWRRRRLDAVTAWGEVELRLGRADAVTAALPDVLAEYPLSEPLEALFMRALHAAGRDAEAIERYAVIRARLADELGTDPGAELRALHSAILRGELPQSEPDSPLATPAQLPPDMPGFAGREEELRLLDDLAGGSATAVRIVAVSGTAGVGKTALVVHWAHRMRGHFPGGQLYVNLRGFDPTGSPVTPAEAVRRFLDAFEVSPQRIPVGFEAQVGLCRSLLANRRVLVVLDNARDAEHVRPLLPGSPDCLVLVTSRDQLSGLVADGARHLTVDLLEADEARRLLAGRLGAERIAAEPRAVDEIVALCARLPLALAVVAARAATHPKFGLVALARELRAARGSLDEFSGADPATDPRAVFSWSYLQLTADAARLFRLTGLHPGPDLGTHAAASLAGLPSRAVRPLLAELSRAHLVTEHSPGRYTCHDLLRAYASEQAQVLDLEPDRRAALRRTLCHYLHTANDADRLLDPRREELPTLTALPPGVTPEPVADRTEALAWFDAEHRVLLAAIQQEPAFDVEVWELIWAMRRFLAHQGHWQDEIDSLNVALAAARRLGDPLKQAFAHCYKGCTYVWFGKYEDACAELDVALSLYREAGDRVGEAYVQFYHSWLLDRQERNVEALSHAEQALELFRAAGHQAGQAKVLNAVGWFHALLGDHETAIGYCRKALDLQTELGDQLGAGQTWHSLGYAYQQLEDHGRAVACYQAAVDLFEASGYRINEAHVLSSLGDALHDAGDVDAARDAWQRSVDILDQLSHPDADDTRVKLTKSTSDT
ncbi:DNA-binding SARP family transcriptional activator/tetratricopeptide (TPR) repeat protein [Saccharothrix ecbatanensis]|uniref:DNA-binding SARP family transcriptional activator/tetratricopeptide (TPR) repeat protein n=1 Tax=Saccharothrix ecbatanensis TaxID=1105145 RepID=A0A7W9HDP4_9PSEU|nr:BTAD domain-containing putative transcriptional regulator [Saccharothrix ecbatanensis]MBB5800373.1 DNA-binding SARP family transcriptional activator/tetratricopeptide (TPR) repeat protein [Saccharothrix ecbatanensis]